jgi:hypothetical protein
VPQAISSLLKSRLRILKAEAMADAVHQDKRMERKCQNANNQPTVEGKRRT